MEKIQKSREKIIALLSRDNTLSAAALAERIGITHKAVEKQIARLKADGVIKRIGPDKGGLASSHETLIFEGSTKSQH